MNTSDTVFGRETSEFLDKYENRWARFMRRDTKDTDKVNTSTVPKEKTARTAPPCAIQRAENLRILGAQKVLELCVGPSLNDLALAYRNHGIIMAGNDIEVKYKTPEDTAKWYIGDAIELTQRYIGSGHFDTFVFAPPLSRGCTGTRADSLAVDWVKPRYVDYLKMLSEHTNMTERVVLVLPARALATAWDRKQYYRLLSQLPRPYEVCELKVKGIRKYIDVYMEGKASKRQIRKNGIFDLGFIGNPASEILLSTPISGDVNW